MEDHSSSFAWRIPGTRSLVGCCLRGRTESDTTEATQQQQEQLLISSPPPPRSSFSACQHEQRDLSVGLPLLGFLALKTLPSIGSLLSQLLGNVFLALKIHDFKYSGSFLFSRLDPDRVTILWIPVIFSWNALPRVCVHMCSVAQSYLTLWNPMDCSPPTPLSTEFSWQEYWSGLPFPPTLGILLTPGLNLSILHLLHWQEASLLVSRLQVYPKISMAKWVGK